jgi:hypothetical protein
MDEVRIEEYISKRSSHTCEVAVRMSDPRVVDRTAVENQRWSGSGESGGPAFEARRIRVEIGDQSFIGWGSTRAHHQEKETERGK